MKGIRYWLGVNESYKTHCANRHTRRCMHRDRMCALLILPALPHFSEATCNVSQPSEGAADAETSREAECRGNLLQGMRRAEEQQQTAGLGRCMPGHIRVGPLLAWGFTAWLGVFSVSKPD